MKEKKRLWVPASYTVEASYLVPVILFLFVLVGTAALYLHDSSAASFDAQAVTTYARMLVVGHDDDAEEMLEEYAASKTDAGFLMTQSTAAEGSIGTWKITSSVTGTIQNAFAERFSDWGWPVFCGFEAEDTEWCLDPCALIRSVRILVGTDD